MSQSSRSRRGENYEAPAPIHKVEAAPSGMGFFQALLLLLVGVGAAIGIFYIVEILGDQTGRFYKTIAKVLGSLASVFATYFLINRALRLRERESDKVIASFMGYIDYLVQLFSRLYSSGPQYDDWAKEQLTAVKGKEWEEIEEYASEHVSPTTRELPQFLIDTFNWPHYLRTAEERLLEIYDASQQVNNLVGVSSPKVGTSAIETLDHYSELFRDDLPVIRRGLRGFEKLRTIAQYAPYIQDASVHKGLDEDINDAVTAILEAMNYTFHKLPTDLEKVMRPALTKFRTHLDKRNHEAYDAELGAITADAELLDID